MSSKKTLEILWSGKPVKVNINYGRGFKIYDKTVEWVWNVIIVAVMTFIAYDFIVNRSNGKYLLLSSLTLIFLFGVKVISKYCEREIFRKTMYELTSTTLEISNWSLLTGTKRTKIYVKDIEKTYIVGFDENIGTVLLYGISHGKAPKDLLTGVRLATVGLQYIQDPKMVKELIDKLRE